MIPHSAPDASDVSVVMASFNERENIAEAIQRISASVGKRLHEIIVVDDNSPDETWKIIQTMNNPRFRVIRRMNERGLASALARGLQETSGEIIVWLDCDLGIPPEDINRLIDKIPPYDVVIGSRYVSGGKDSRSKFRAFLSMLINIYALVILGFGIRDYTSGFVAVKREVLRQVKFTPAGFGEYFIEFVYGCKKKNFRVTEVGYIYSDRKGGSSKSSDNLGTLFKYGFQYGLKIIKFRFTVK